MKTRIRLISLCALSLCLFACKNNGDISSLPEPSTLERQWMEKSWLEYIIEVKDVSELTGLESLNKKNNSEFIVEKIKPFEKNKYVITLNKETKYKVVYQSLMPLKQIKSIQPNFSYFAPPAALKFNLPDTH